MKNRLVFRTGAVYQKKLVFFAQYGFPFFMDIETGKIHIYSSVLNMQKQNAHIDATVVNGEFLYAFSVDGKNMHEYDLKGGIYCKYDINCNCGDDNNYAFIHQSEGKIFVFSKDINRSFFFEIGDKTRTQLSIGRNELEYKHGVCKETTCFIFPKKGRIVFEYDVISKKSKEVILPFGINNLAHVSIQDDKIYILEKNGTVKIWNITTREYVIYEEIRNYYNFENAVSRICLCNESAIILPFFSNDIIKFSFKDKSITIWDEYPLGFRYENNTWAKYIHYTESDNYYFYSNRTSGYIMRIDKSNLDVVWIESEISDLEMNGVEMKRSALNLWKESNRMNLDSFLFCVKI